jgi:hypothetical protein
MQRIKIILVTIIAIIALALIVHKLRGPVGPSPAVNASPAESPFKALPLRYDGHYRQEDGGVVYLIRFFPDGRAVLVNGLKDKETELPPLLVHDAVGNPRLGYYNVPVTVEGDSMFFITRPTRGEISYRGKAMDRQRVIFDRLSHINGDRRLKEYLFQPDSTAVSQ